MKRNLKINRLTVRRGGLGLYGRHSENIPLLRISGKWLEALGFTIGAQVQITTQGNSLVITKGGQQ